MTVATLKYQSEIHVGGHQFACVESYESLLTRMKEASMGVTGEDEDTARVAFPAPIEVTVRSTTGPMRVAVSPGAISALIDVPLEMQGDVEG